MGTRRWNCYRGDHLIASNVTEVDRVTQWVWHHTPEHEDVSYLDIRKAVDNGFCRIGAGIVAIVAIETTRFVPLEMDMGDV